MEIHAHQGALSVAAWGVIEARSCQLTRPVVRFCAGGILPSIRATTGAG